MRLFVLVFGSVWFLTVQAFGGPLVIRSGLHSQHQEAQRGQAEDTNFGKVRLANYEALEGFNQGDERHLENAKDSASFQSGSRDSLLQKAAKDVEDKEFKQADGASVSDAGSQVGHKKGHQKSGFHHTYHKDESGSNSSYFDEALDAGDHFNRNRNQGVFGATALRNEATVQAADKEHSKDAWRQGHHHSGGQLEKSQGGGNAFHRQHIGEDNRAAGNFGGGASVTRAQFGSQPPPYHPRRPPAYDNSISIYEEPKYARPAHYHDYDRFHQPPRHYNDHYDYYYY